MIIVVDTNIVISALINPKGKECNIILDPLPEFEKYSCYFLTEEILGHKEKILNLSKFNEIEFVEALFHIFKRIKLINEEQIPEVIWRNAFEITKDVDETDTPFVALSLYLEAYLWTGDKKLITGLRKKGYKRIVTSNELLKKAK